MATQFLGQGAVQGFVSDPLWKAGLTFVVAGLGVLIAYLDKTVAINGKKNDTP